MVSSKNIEPLISVIVPCYRQAQFLEEALNSVLAQTYPNWECIIVNDGSDDNTEEIVAVYLNKDNRFKHIYQENGGLASARNSGLRLAIGTFVQFLDADDYLTKEKFGSLIARLRTQPELELLISNFASFNEREDYIKPYCDLDRELNLDSIIKYWDIEFTIPIHCALFNKKLLTNGFYERLKAKEDWLMWVDVFQQQPNICFENLTYAFYRSHPQSMTKDETHMENYTMEVYSYIYHRLRTPYLKNLIFDRFFQYSQQLKNNKDFTINFLTNSYTYRIGNIVLYPLKKIKSICSIYI